jgi:hypothetical protein
MNKMVINHLEKLFVTSDASTIVTEMDVYHPAAKLLVMAAKAQAGEVGDGTNLVSHHGLPYCLDRPAAWQQQGGGGGLGLRCRHAVAAEHLANGA